MCLNHKVRDSCDSEMKSSLPTLLQFGIEDDQIHDQFYRELCVTVRQTPAGGVVILLGDMNANHGDSECPGVGPVSEDRENNNGTRLRAFAAECSMAFMNTYMDGAPLSSWRASRGHEHRIDFAAISMKDFGRVLHAGVHRDVKHGLLHRNRSQACLDAGQCVPTKTSSCERHTTMGPGSHE